MKCGGCGADNPDFAIYCCKCGNSIPKQRPDDSGSQRTTEPSVADTRELADAKPTPKMAFCCRCGKEISVESYTCAFCGEKPWERGPSRWERVYDTSNKYSHEDVVISERPESSMPLLGGVMAILAGVFALGQGLLYLAGSAAIDLPGTGSLCLCGGLDSIFGLASIAGGVCSIKRENFVIALLGAVLGMLGFGFVIGFLFGLLALVFIAISRTEFQS